VGENVGKKLLEGLKVADFTAVIAGTLITKTIAAYGAEVIKIEGRGHPDLFRRGSTIQDDIFSNHYVPWLNRGSSFGMWNTGKLSIALNLGNPKGIEIAKRFVARADIVVENFAGGVMERLGLGYEALRKVKPDIIMLSSCMQGQTGPHANHPGYGTQLVNLAGFGTISGWPDREPAAIGAYTDYVAPRFSLLAIMAALDYRYRTGKGQYIDLSQYESGLQFMAPLLLDYSLNRRIAERVGNCSPYAAPHGVYPCCPRHTDDRWCLIAVYTNEEWNKFCNVIGNPEWTRDVKFGTLRARRENEQELDKLVEQWTVNYLPEDITRRMREAGVWARIAKTANELEEHQPPAKHRSPYAAPHNVYRCRWEDRWCTIAVSTGEEWESFCRVIGNPEWTRDARFSTLHARLENTEELDRLVGEWTITRTAEEVMTVMQASGVAAGVVATGEDMMEKDPQLKHRHFFHELQHPEIGRYRGTSPSFILSKNPCEITRAPLMGEHNEYALKELLGMSDKEISDLIKEGILE
jgi:benzylsuccinate CoA-transferase BbsF subunit